MNTDVTCKHGHDEYLVGTVCPQCEKEKADAEAAIRAAEHQARMKEVYAQQREERDKKLEMVASKIREAGHTSHVVDHSLVVNGIDVGLYIDFDTKAKPGYGGTRSMFSRMPVPTIPTIVVGQYGDRSVYPLRQDGSYNWEPIVTKLVGAAERKNRQAQAGRNKKANEKVAADFKKRNGMHPTWNPRMQVDPTAVRDLPLKIEIKFMRHMTVDDAQKLHDMLAAAGFFDMK